MAASIRLPRRRRGLLASLVALVGLAAAAAGGVFAFYAAARHAPWLVDADAVSRWGRSTSLSGTLALVVGIAAAVVGLLLLAAAVVPPRRGVVELAEPDPTIAAGVTRASLFRTLAAAAIGVDGISGASVAGRRRLTVRVTTRRRLTAGLAERVETVVGERLELLGPDRAMPVRVRLVQKER